MTNDATVTQLTNRIAVLESLLAHTIAAYMRGKPGASHLLRDFQENFRKDDTYLSISRAGEQEAGEEALERIFKQAEENLVINRK